MNWFFLVTADGNLRSLRLYQYDECTFGSYTIGPTDPSHKVNFEWISVCSFCYFGGMRSVDCVFVLWIVCVWLGECVEPAQCVCRLIGLIPSCFVLSIHTNTFAFVDCAHFSTG